MKRLPLYLLSLFTISLFWRISHSFYQQDEWHGLGDIISNGITSIFITTNDPLSIALGAGRVGSNLLVYFFYYYFKFNIAPIALFVISLHLGVALLLYHQAYKITNKKLPALFSALFFVSNSVSAGSITWPASGISTISAGLLIVLALCLFIDYIEKENGNRLKLIFLLLYLSLFFKETAMPFFILLPISSLIFRKISPKHFIQKYWYFILFTILAVGYRLVLFKNIETQKDLFLTGASQSYTATLLVRSIMYPVTSFSLMFFPAAEAFSFAKHLTWIYYPFFDPSLYDLIAQTAVLDTLAIFLTLIIIFSLFLLFRTANITTRKQVLLILGFTLISFLPYVVISKTFSYLESRYYYLATAGASLLIAQVLTRLTQVINTKVVKVIYIAFLFLLFVHIREVRREVTRQVSLGKERLAILEAVTKIKPELSGKNIFYLTGDRNYYISDGNPSPMQQGMGYTLLVWYTARANAPEELKSLIRDYYLWELNGQGYKEIDGVGYGYFWDLTQLKELQKRKDIDITGLYYNSKEQTIADITNEL